MTKLCARGKSAAKRKFKVYPSAYANAYASKICAGKIKDPSGTKRKDWGPKKAKLGMAVNAGSQSALGRLEKSGFKGGGVMKAFKGKYFDEQKTNVKGKDRTGPVPGGKTPEIPPEEFMKHKKYKHRRVISAKVGINVNTGGESALGRLQKSGMLKAYTGKAVRQPSETNKEFEMRHAYHTPFMKYKPKMLLGGLLTKGIRQGIRSYVKASGKKTKDLVKLQPMKSRTSAKTDMARGIQLHTKSLEDKKRLQKYIRFK